MKKLFGKIYENWLWQSEPYKISVVEKFFENCRLKRNKVFEKEPKEHLARKYADEICGVENRKTRGWFIVYYAFIEGYKCGESK
jgi:hypothetical protein